MADGTIPYFSAQQTENVARLLTIKQHEGGARALWEPNAEQRKFWAEREHHQWVYVVKPRQIGLSTAVCLDDVLWTAAADGAGHKVRTAIVVDTDEKAKERLAVCADFCSQLTLDYEQTTERITFPGGSEIVAFTASGFNVGRSFDVQRLHLTELPFWRDPAGTYNDLMQALSIGCACVIETTMETTTPFARWLWDTSREYHRVFFKLEEHDEYRRDPQEIDDDEWRRLQREGFTDRSAASWFSWARREKCGGDEVKAFKEYPQNERHLFQVSSGLWVSKRPHPVDPVETFTVLGIRGDDWLVNVYKRPGEVTKPLLAVDTAEGKGLDRCVALVVDEADWRVAALCVSSKMIFDDLARVTLELQQRYGGALALIEEGGIGSATVAAAATLGVVHDIVTPTQEGKYEGLLAAKMAVESGLLVGPHELTEECDELHRDPKTGDFKGRKDIMMTYGMCARRMKEAPWLAPKKAVNIEERIDGKRIIRNLMRQERMRGWR